MAKTIVTWCDKHLAAGEEVSATSTQIGIDGRASELDLCDECRTEILSPLLALLDEYGQPVKTSQPGERVQCPACEKSYKSARSLGDHIRRYHAEADIKKGDVPLIALPESERADERKYPCPDCERMFLRPQAVGAHRARIHGYVSPTHAENKAAHDRKKTKAGAA